MQKWVYFIARYENRNRNLERSGSEAKFSDVKINLWTKKVSNFKQTINCNYLSKFWLLFERNESPAQVPALSPIKGAGKWQTMKSLHTGTLKFG